MSVIHSPSLIETPSGIAIDRLNELAVAGLASMFNRSSQLFCTRMRREGSGLVAEGISRRYTIISLLGLQNAAAHGLKSPVEVPQILDGLLRSASPFEYAGDQGLLLWLVALAAPERLSEFSSQLDSAAKCWDFRECRTMELAWLLAGMSHAIEVRPATSLQLKQAATEVCRLLLENQGGYGLFGHMAIHKSLSGHLRGHLGSFADQVYPIYALTMFAKACGVPAALAAALKCAEAICQTQGPLGQWWWHYDARTGHVFEPYPVYSVHQDGMAPMALFAVGDASGRDFHEAIHRGLQWIAGENELAADLRDTSHQMIWRSIYCGNRSRNWISRFRALAGAETATEICDLRVLFECRPYHLGWLLYAFAGRTGL